MTAQATKPGAAADPQPRLRDALAGGGRPVVVAELVPWAGALDDPAGERARWLATELEADRRISALSITDNAGGHARLSPEVLASELVGRGGRVIVHVTCRDRNRSELSGRVSDSGEGRWTSIAAIDVGAPAAVRAVNLARRGGVRRQGAFGNALWLWWPLGEELVRTRGLPGAP